MEILTQRFTEQMPWQTSTTGHRAEPEILSALATFFHTITSDMLPLRCNIISTTLAQMLTQKLAKPWLKASIWPWLLLSCQPNAHLQVLVNYVYLYMSINVALQPVEVPFRFRHPCEQFRPKPRPFDFVHCIYDSCPTCMTSIVPELTKSDINVTCPL